jgi:hypothetical protein
LAIRANNRKSRKCLPGQTPAHFTFLPSMKKVLEHFQLAAKKISEKLNMDLLEAAQQVMKTFEQYSIFSKIVMYDCSKIKSFCSIK